ncbi:MAG: hypothetical protein K2N78_01965, partial [Oscillospiraceae bacterium]|nr:hypothetical protein [Oscillospiraceae bacterium]
MKKNNKVRTFLCVILAATVLTAFVAMAAGDPGSRSDPLVTLSYLTGTFTTQIMDKVDGLLDQRNAGLSKELGDKLARLPSGSGGAAGDSYAAVTLSAGQTLYGEAGCEVLLRTGSARCVGEGAVGLMDATTGGDLGSGGTLTANHLYLMPESRGVASAEGAALLVRGSYTIEQ